METRSFTLRHCVARLPLPSGSRYERRGGLDWLPQSVTGRAARTGSTPWRHNSEDKIDSRVTIDSDTMFSRVTRALQHRNFRLFFGGQTISLTGTWITRVATS